LTGVFLAPPRTPPQDKIFFSPAGLSLAHAADEKTLPLRAPEGTRTRDWIMAEDP